MTRLTGAAARVRLAAVTAAIAALSLAACSSSTSPGASQASAGSPPARSSHAVSAPSASGASTQSPGADPSSTGPARTAVSITIKQFAYRVSGQVAPGATVQVTNDDSTEHTVTADSGHRFDVAVQPGKTATFAAPHTTGRYRFHCDFHSDMHGTLIVK